MKGISDHGEDAAEVGFAREGLRALRAAVCLAEEMGEGVGRGAVLLGPVPQPEDEKPADWSGRLTARLRAGEIFSRPCAAYNGMREYER
jgi:hypothetical protein